MSKLDLSIIIKFVDRATQPIRQFQQNVQNTNQSIDRLTHAVDRLEQGLNGTSLSRYSRQLNTGSSNINRQTHALDGLHHGYDKVAHTIDTVRKKSQALSASFAKSRVQMRQQMKELAMTTTVGGIGAYQFLKPAIDFEKQMSGVQSVLDLNKKDPAMKMLNDDARKWGASSSFSPGETAQAEFALGSGGFNADQIHKSLGGTLQLAEAGKIELERAAQIAVGTLNGFGLAADKIGRVNDVFLKGTNLTATSVDGLGETMKYVAPIAKAYGASIEQATAMTGLLGNANILDTQAGTSLRSIFTRFAAPPKDAADALDALKVKTTDAKGNMRDISDVLAEINRKTAKMGEAKRLGIFKDIAGQEAVSGFAVLVAQAAVVDEKTGKTINKVKELTKELENSEGAAARAAKILKDNLAGDIEQLGGSIQDLSIGLLNAFGTDLRQFVKSIGGMIDRIKVWVEANPQLVQTIGNLALKLLMFKVAMLGVRYTGNLLFGTIFSLIAGITKLSLMLWLLSKAADRFGINLPSRFTLITKGIRYLAQSFMFLARNALPLVLAGLRMLAVGLLTNPLTLIITGIAVAALLIYKYWAPIKAFFTGFWEGLTSGFAATKLIISDFFDSIAPAVEPIKPAWNWLLDKFTIFKGVLGEIFAPFAATNDQLKNANSYGQIFGTWVAIVTSALLAMKVALMGVAAIQGLVAFFSTLTVGLSGAAVAAWSFMAPFLPMIAVIAAVLLVVGALAAAAYWVIKNWEPIEAFFSDLGTTISEKFTSIKQSITDKFAPIGSWFGARMTEAKTAFGGGIGGMSKLITNWSPLGLFYSVFAKVLSWFGIDLPAKFTDFGSLIINGLINGLTSGFEKLKGVWANIKSYMPSFSFSSPAAPAYAGIAANPALASIPVVTPPLVSKVKPVTIPMRSASPAPVQSSTVNHINIHPTPGMSPEQVAKQVRTEMDRRDQQKQARARSSYTDHN